MPVRVGKCGKKWCVKDPDGTVVPGGEHDTEQEAVDHAAAINANTEKGAMSESVTTTTDDYTLTTAGSNTTHIVKDSNTTNIPIEFPKLEDEVYETIEEKGLEEAMAFGPETFDELEELREHNEKMNAITKVVSDFMALVGNVFSWPGGNKSSKIKQLANEMIKRLPEDDEDIEPESDAQEIEEEKGQEEDDVDNARKDGFFIWKDESGEYRWLGVYSNKFRDNDHPAEILSEKAHIDFIERVEKGELPYPDLYVWHIKSPVGKADLLAYDDSGFSIAAGTIQEDFALALMKSNEDLAMSHGMPSEFIERSKEDPTVITAYVSTEVSVLPRRAAANKRTEFRIIKEDAMAIVPAEKRAEVVDLLGEDLTEKLETGLGVTAKTAHADGVESKEESVDNTDAVAEDVATEETVEGAEEATEDPVEPESEVKDEEVAEEEAELAEAPAEDAPVAQKGDKEDTTSGSEDVTSEKEELAETLATIIGPILEGQAALVKGIESLNDRITAIEEDALARKQAGETASEQAGEDIGTPTASMMEVFMKRLSEPARSVIGQPEAAVHGNANLAKAKPKETEEDAEGQGANGGLFWKQFS